MLNITVAQVREHEDMLAAALSAVRGRSPDSNPNAMGPVRFVTACSLSESVLCCVYSIRLLTFRHKRSAALILTLSEVSFVHMLLLLAMTVLPDLHPTRSSPRRSRTPSDGHSLAPSPSTAVYAATEHTDGLRSVTQTLHEDLPTSPQRYSNLKLRLHVRAPYHLRAILRHVV